MTFVFLGHIIGDFYAQTNEIAKNKKKHFGFMLLHVVLYFICMAICLNFASYDFLDCLFVAVVISLGHLLVDIIKSQFEKKYESDNKHRGAIVFVLDQVVHVALIIITCALFKRYGIEFNVEYSFLTKYKEAYIIRNYAIYTNLILICYKPASFFVSAIFGDIPETIEEADSIGDKQCQKKDEVENENLKIGSWIGILEREIILLLGIIGQFGAIGFVLTAKSLARYKQLEKKEFAEKYLVGTLISAMIAIVCVAIARLCIIKPTSL